MSRNRRTEYRIVYPIGDRPRMEIADEEYEVLDLSESGLRLLAPELIVETSQTIRGMLRFADGGRAFVTLGVLRQNNKHVVVQFLGKKLQYSRIVEEQRYLLAKYGRNLIS